MRKPHESSPKECENKDLHEHPQINILGHLAEKIYKSLRVRRPGTAANRGTCRGIETRSPQYMTLWERIQVTGSDTDLPTEALIMLNKQLPDYQGRYMRFYKLIIPVH